MENLDVYGSTVPSLDDEFRETIKGLVENAEPRTVTHALLLERDDLYTREGLAAVIGRQTCEIEGVLAALEEAGWVLRFTENGLEKFTFRSPE